MLAHWLNYGQPHSPGPLFLLPLFAPPPLRPFYDPIEGLGTRLVASSVEEKSSLLQTIIATRRVKRQEYVGCIAMNCRRANTDASRRLIAILADSQKAIADSQPVIHYYSHVVYAFLRTKLTVVA